MSWIQEWLAKLGPQPARPSAPRAVKVQASELVPRSSLIKDYPYAETLEARYGLVQDSWVVDSLFSTLKEELRLQALTLEAGKTPQGRYLYVGRLNQPGLLFEQSPVGWIVAQAHKVVSQDLFVRDYEAWDVVTLYTPVGSAGAVRVSSQRCGGELVSFNFYRNKLLAAIAATVNQPDKR